MQLVGTQHMIWLIMHWNTRVLSQYSLQTIHTWKRTISHLLSGRQQRHYTCSWVYINFLAWNQLCILIWHKPALQTHYRCLFGWSTISCLCHPIYVGSCPCTQEHIRWHQDPWINPHCCLPCREDIGKVLCIDSWISCILDCSWYVNPHLPSYWLSLGHIALHLSYHLDWFHDPANQIPVKWQRQIVNDVKNAFSTHCHNHPISTEMTGDQVTADEDELCADDNGSTTDPLNVSKTCTWQCTNGHTTTKTDYFCWNHP